MSADVSQSVPLDPALLARFREQGAALVAHERGLTPACRIKLAEIARSLGIAESQTEEAIHSLTTAPSAPPNPRVERFRRRLRKDLTGKKRPIIDAALEAKIVAAAGRKYALPARVAGDVLAEVAVELGLTRITASDALQNVRAQIEQAVGDSTWLAREAWDRLRSAGAKWGIDIDVVDGLIDLRLAANRAERAQRNYWIQTTLYGAGGAVLVACVILAGLVLGGGRSHPADTTAGVPAETPLARATTPPPTWWDVDLAVEMMQAKTRLGGLAGAHQLLSSAVAAERATGYERLFEQVRAAPEDGVLTATAARLVSSCYALDPAEAAADRIRAALVQFLPAADRPLPARAAELELAFWAADAAASALHRPRSISGRATALAEALSSYLGGGIDPAASRAEHRRLLRERTILAAYQQLTVAATRHPKEVAAVYSTLAERALVELPAEEFLRAEATLLIAALPAAGERWTDFERPLARCIASPDPLPALRLVEALRRATQPSLVERLSELLQVRAGIRPSSRSKKEVILAVRKALGGAPGLTAADRWLALEEEAAPALSERAASDEPALLTQAVQLTHLTTLALALSQGEAGFATFDAGLAEPPQLESRAADAGLGPRGPGSAKSTRRLTKTQQRDLGRYLGALDKRGATYQPERESALRGLATLAAESTEISPQQATAIADYLLAEKSSAEQAKAFSALTALRNWPQLGLAVADALPTAKWTVHQQRDLVARLLHRDLADEYTPESLRRALLADVAESLASELSVPASGQRMHDAAASAIAASYRQRATLLNVAPTALAAAQTPGQVLEQALMALAAPTARTKASDLAQRLPSELQAASYLATNDLERTLAVQQLFLEASGRKIATERPQRAAAVREIVAQSDAAVAACGSALVQLHIQETALFRLWMLYAPDA